MTAPPWLVWRWLHCRLHIVVVCCATQFLLDLSGGNPAIQEEQSLEMRGRDCLACSVLASPGTPSNTNAAGNAVSEGMTARGGSKEHMTKAPRAAELYMILDENLLLLATPDRFKLTYGTVKSAVAIHHIDVSISGVLRLCSYFAAMF